MSDVDSVDVGTECEVSTRKGRKIKEARNEGLVNLTWEHMDYT